MRPSLLRILTGLYVQKLKYIPVTWKEVHLRGRPDAAVQRSPLLAPPCKQGLRGRWRIKPPPSAGPPSARE